MELRNFTRFSLEYVDVEKRHSFGHGRFGGHQTLAEREMSFYARNQTLHCGFVKGPPGSSSTGFDVDEKDAAYMNACNIVVSSCIFGSSDFLRRPATKKVKLLCSLDRIFNSFWSNKFIFRIPGFAFIGIDNVVNPLEIHHILNLIVFNLLLSIGNRSNNHYYDV